MSRVRKLLNRIRYVLKMKPLVGNLIDFKQYYADNYNVAYIPVPPYQRPQVDTVAIKLSENSNFRLEKLSFVGFTEAVSSYDSCSIRAKKVDILNCETGFFVRESRTKKETKVALDLDGVTFKNGKKGIRAPDTYDIKARNTSFDNVDVGIDIYLSKAEILEIGLPEDTPLELISEAIAIIKKSEKEDAVEGLSKSNLFSWLGIASNTVTIATPIVQALMAFALSSGQ